MKYLLCYLSIVNSPNCSRNQVHLVEQLGDTSVNVILDIRGAVQVSAKPLNVMLFLMHNFSLSNLAVSLIHSSTHEREANPCLILSGIESTLFA